MNKLLMSTQAHSNLTRLPQKDCLFINQALSKLKDNPELGLKLWGQEDLYLYQAATDLKIVYKLVPGEIQVVEIGLSRTPPISSRDKIAAIILAAGKAAYGDTPAPLLSLGGVPLICQVTETFLTTSIDELIVVLGYQAEEVKKELRNKQIKIITNPNYERGLSSSLRYGLRLVSRDTAGVVLTLGNRPFITPEVIDKLITAYKKDRMPIVAPTHHQVRGHPVIFDATLIPELFRARGNIGGRGVIRHHRRELAQVEVKDAGVLRRIENYIN